MRRAPVLLAIAYLSACRATIPEGRFACTADSECPDGWMCIDGHCYSSADAGRVDAGGRDAALPDGALADGGDAGVGPAEGEACAASEPRCASGLVCDASTGGADTCQLPFVIRGIVAHIATDVTPIGGAQVIALDQFGLALSGTAVSQGDGTYELTVSVPRSSTGAPEPMPIVLYASAPGYLRQPRGFVRSTEINAADATREATAWALDGTGIALLPIAAGTGWLSISGRVIAAEQASVLVVVENGGLVHTALSDRDGAYTIFNVPPGTVTVRGYRAGVALEPVTMSLTADATGVELTASSAALSAVSGEVQIVNAPATSTRVQLVVASTYDSELELGDVPYGLRSASVTGPWAIQDVPPGSYLAVAAMENDALTLDPDESIAGIGPQPVGVDGTGAAVTVPTALKVTAAVSIVMPGLESAELVNPPITFVWNDVSSEDAYRVRVHDARGVLVWESADLPAGGGDLAYGGPALEYGMHYRFRVTALQDVGGMLLPMQRSEQQSGVFLTLPP